MREAIALINGGLIDPNDFEPAPGEEEGIWLGQTAKLYFAQLERQLQDSILYPPQHRKLKLNQILLEQGRSLGGCLVETRLDYEAFTLR